MAEAAETQTLPVKGNDINNIPGLRQILLLVGIAASVALGVAVVLWSQSPNYSLLYGNLEDRDANQVIEALQAAEIPYRLREGTGAIMVPAAQVHQARLELASQGLPQGASMGVELIQQDQGYGMSQFMENARYHHVLETELSRTISNLQPVQNARVHLALPKQSVFVRDREGASASVLLHLYAGRRMERDQVASIVHLVASSIPNLDPGQVTVIDQRGRLLSSPEDSREYALTASQFEHTRRVEESYAERIKDLLVPLIGPGRVRAQVVADLDFTVAEETRQSFAPDRTALLSEEVTASESRGESRPSGVPGALSNQPPPDDTAAAEDTTGTEIVPLSNSSSAVRNYEVDKTISHVRQPSGAVRRLSVAVLVDDMQSINDEGAVESTALTPLELERITDLVKEAVGFDEPRGDTVKVINASFHAPPPLEPAEEPPFWEKPFVRDLIKQGLGAVLVLVLAFGLLRPMFRGLLQPPQPPAQILSVQAGGEILEAGQGVPAAAPAGAPALASVPRTYDEKVAAAKNLVGQDPKQVAQVVKQWVSTDD